MRFTAPEAIQKIKKEAPGGVIRLFTSEDMKRAYIMRGIRSWEVKRIQERIFHTNKTITPELLASRKPSSRPSSAACGRTPPPTEP